MSPKQAEAFSSSTSLESNTWMVGVAQKRTRCVTHPDLSRLQGDHMSPGFLERREPPQVGLENIDLAEDARLFVGYPGGVKLGRVLRGKKVPTLPSDRKKLHEN